MSKLKQFVVSLLFSAPLFAGSYSVDVPAGRISVSDSRPNSSKDFPTIVFLHGHCTNKTFFSQQIESPLLKPYRLICLDLPGYGESSPPKNPEKTYSFPGYADAVAEVIDDLELENVVVVGWSLGGHVALELTSRLSQLKGILITGTPPLEISSEGFGRGFQIPNPKILEYFGKGTLTEEEAELMATISGYDYTPEKRFLVDAIFQTDEGAKTLYPKSILQGVGQNEVEIVGTWPKPIAVVLGEKDAVINHDYIQREVHFRNLWKNQVFVIEGAGHAVHMEAPEQFNAILQAFFQDVFLP